MVPADSGRADSASRLSASASSSSGLPLARAASSNALPHSPLPRPGPMATTSTRASNGDRSPADSTAWAMISGCRASEAGTCEARVAMLARPAPLRSAACAHRRIAPPLPWSPPMHKTWPWSPLWLSRARGWSMPRFYTCNVEIPDPATLATRLKALASEAGFQRFGISGVDLGEDEAHLRDWLAQGLYGSMEWMARHGDKRSRPPELVPGTLRLLSVGMDDGRDADEAWANLREGERGYVARYALGRDYHKLMRQRLQRLADRIAAEIGPFGHRVFVDSAPVLERALARNAGLGWIGKHTCLIDKDGGSWFFLGEIYLDLPLPVDAPAGNHCGTCRRCIDVCPTQAITAPYRLDARRCISYLTIEHEGAIDAELRPLIGNRIFGCDDCQLVCPW